MVHLSSLYCVLTEYPLRSNVCVDDKAVGTSSKTRLAVPGTIWYFLPPLEQAPIVYVLIVYLPRHSPESKSA